MSLKDLIETSKQRNHDELKLRVTQKIGGSFQVLSGNNYKIFSDIVFKITYEHVKLLIEKANEAEKYRKKLIKNDKTVSRDGAKLYLSKMANVPGSLKLVPDSFRPQDTILVELGKAAAIKNEKFAVIADRSSPYWNSMGPNGVLLATETSPYGTEKEPRINLFYKSTDDVKRLLTDYKYWFYDNRNAVYDLFISSIAKSIENNDPSGTGKIQWPEDELQDMKLLLEMFTEIKNEAARQKLPLSLLGIEVQSFCQTWAKESVIGPPQFSVMSPHFQTRITVDYSHRKKKYEQAYIRMEQKMLDRLLSAGYKEAFVEFENVLRALDTSVGYRDWYDAMGM